MNDETNQETQVEEQQAAARDAANWAKSVSRLNVSEVPDGAVNINVEDAAWPRRSRASARCGRRPTRCGSRPSASRAPT